MVLMKSRGGEVFPQDTLGRVQVRNNGGTLESGRFERINNLN